jgi:glutamyl/glutaminyl-tRNA synthetase|tara:strand:- start:119 stop:457 length:339 start_codon:yes stop_codon:yes gene_type:complete
MKKTIKIFFVLLLCSFNSFAQNNYQTKRATSFSEYAAKQVELSQEDQKFLYDTFIAKFVKQQEKIKGKDLSDEEKKQVYKASRKELVKTLNGRFDSEKTKAILAAVKEIRNK